MGSDGPTDGSRASGKRGYIRLIATLPAVRPLWPTGGRHQLADTEGAIASKARGPHPRKLKGPASASYGRRFSRGRTRSRARGVAAEATRAPGPPRVGPGTRGSRDDATRPGQYAAHGRHWLAKQPFRSRLHPVSSAGVTDGLDGVDLRRSAPGRASTETDAGAAPAHAPSRSVVTPASGPPCRSAARSSRCTVPTIRSNSHGWDRILFKMTSAVRRIGVGSG